MGLSLSLNDYLYNTVLYTFPIGIANLYIIEGFYALENIAMKHSQAHFSVQGLITPAPRRLSSKFVTPFGFSRTGVSFFGR